MTPFEGLLLGIIQGLTEFLPVSSSGHLVMGQELLGISLPGVWFEIAVHVATLVSVLVVYRARVTTLAVGAVRGERSAWRYVGLLLLATVPAAIVGIFLGDVVEGLFEAPVVTGLGLLFTGGVLASSRRPLSRDEWIDDGGLRMALVMGLAQALAIIPGVSRSGATVVTGLWSGVHPERAAEFSFLMAVPAIGGAAVLKLPELLANSSGQAGIALFLGAGAAGITGVLAIRTFVVMLRRRSFPAFGAYCVAAGAAFLGYLALS